jgi:hypothetical protein
VDKRSQKVKDKVRDNVVLSLAINVPWPASVKSKKKKKKVRLSLYWAVEAQGFRDIEAPTVCRQLTRRWQ